MDFYMKVLAILGQWQLTVNSQEGNTLPRLEAQHPFPHQKLIG